jgi:ABC-2 type transport system ATP-binding protein
LTAALHAEGLVRRFGEIEALRGVSFDVAEGELFGLIGPDGAGKTTTIRALAGLISIDGGAVSVLGSDPLRQGAAVREVLGLMPQYYSLYGDLTVIENLRFFGRLFCLPRAAFASRVERLLEITRLAPFVERRADALSGGMYKKLALACALLHEPRVLLLDEPTNGVDPISRRELWELLHEFVVGGMAVLISTPYMDEAERCQRVGLIHQGRLLALGRPQEMVRQQRFEAFEVSGSTRDRLEPLLAGLDEVMLVSPAGSRVRIAVAEGGRGAVAAALGPLGAALAPVPVNFEDLFLVRIAEEGQASTSTSTSTTTSDTGAEARP